MVMRKPVPHAVNTLQSSTNNPPYPSTPQSPNRPAPQPPTTRDEVYSPSLHSSPAFNLSNLEDAQRSGSNPWASTDDRDELPSSLKIGAGRKGEEGLPASLQAGRPGGSPRHSGDSQRPDATKQQSIWASAPEVPKQHSGSSQRSNNPYYQTQNGKQSSEGNESSASIWGEANTGALGPQRLTPQSNSTPPIEMAANLSLSDRPFSEYSPSYRPSVPYSGPLDSTQQDKSPAHPRQESIGVGPHDGPPNLAFTAASPVFDSAQSHPSQRLEERQSITSVTSAGTNRTNSSLGWDPGMDITTFDAQTSRSHGLPGVNEVEEPLPIHRTWEEQKEWEKSERERRDIEAAVAAERAQMEEQERRAEEEWHKGEEAAMRQAELMSLNGAQGPARPHIGPQTSGVLASGSAPPLPRRSQEGSPSLPPRPAEEYTGSSRAQKATKTQSQRQTSETYFIKQINWYDASSPKNPRQSPILVQNANGPCPLLALVNALTLSTPAGVNTALVETLRVREQVSLGLLLDAVFDELMSGRRGDAAQELPDVSDLYAFLVTLHTGMNVNPRFVPPPRKPPNLMDDTEGSQPEIHPALRDEAKPGTFEATREMRLYSTFSVPLIHGWLPPPDHPAYTSLERSAKTYEDAQNLLFREEELEEKSQREGLSFHEQMLVEDIAVIKDFLMQSATQLTSYGLDTLSECVPPGGIAILFRNDHFSTLYKHPHSHQLLSLVTDMGYAGHAEVVWESLVDVNGEGAEFFAGDFRPVGHVIDSPKPKSRQGGGQPVRSLLDDDESWTTVERGSRKSNKTTPGGTGLASPSNTRSSAVGSIDDHLEAPPPPGVPNTEQEDHDLALALQLQEEEDDRLRREIAQRRREDALSQQFLSEHAQADPTPRQSGRRLPESRPVVPTRRPGASAHGAPPSAEADVPPPSYEQAANSTPYYPPPDHPASPTSTRPPGRQREDSAYSANSAAFVTVPGPMMGRGGRRGSRTDQVRTQAGQIRAQAQNLLNEVQGTAVGPGGMRRRTSGSGGIGQPIPPHELDGGKKDCIVM